MQGSVPEGTSLTKMTYKPPTHLAATWKGLMKDLFASPICGKSANQKPAAVKGCSPAGVEVVGGEVLENQAGGGKPAKEGWWSWEG